MRVPDIRKTAERAEFCEAFAQLPFERQLEQFLYDVDHPPHYYPSWFALRILERLRQLPRIVRLGILWRVRGRRHGPWKRVKCRIAARHCSRRRRGYVWPWENGGR